MNIDPTPPVHQLATQEGYSHEGFLFNTVMGQPVGFVAGDRALHQLLRERLKPLITGEDGLQITRALAAMVEPRRPVRRSICDAIARRGAARSRRPDGFGCGGRPIAE